VKSNDEQVAFAVPSGNFGNICAGHIARMMGLPIGRWCWRPTRTTCSTSSSAPASIARAARPKRARPRARRWISRRPPTSSASSSIWSGATGQGARVVGQGRRRRQLRPARHALLCRLPEFGFVSGSSTHADRLATIRLAFEKYGTMIDPHTADGLKVALEQRPAGMTTLVLETALPVKFEETIREALNRAPERPASLEGIESLPQRVEVMNPDVDAVKRFVVAHVGT
jgi:threonine synthase